MFASILLVVFSLCCIRGAQRAWYYTNNFQHDNFKQSLNVTSFYPGKSINLDLTYFDSNNDDEQITQCAIGESAARKTGSLSDWTVLYGNALLKYESSADFNSTSFNKSIEYNFLSRLFNGRISYPGHDDNANNTSTSFICSLEYYLLAMTFEYQSFANPRPLLGEIGLYSPEEDRFEELKWINVTTSRVFAATVIDDTKRKHK